MGAGLSREAEYQRVYSRLHQIQKELADKGVASVYNDRKLTGQNFTNSMRFTIVYKRLNASNGESCLTPQVAINNGEYFDGNYKAAITRLMELFAAKPEPSFAERINPGQFGFSPKLVALVGAIIGHDYGARDRKGGQLSSLSITSDGYVMAQSTAHESGAFIGNVGDLEANLSIWKDDLSPEDQAEFNRLYVANVKDWRNY
jgi:hypothetical protein